MSENLRKVNDGQVKALEYLSSKMESQPETRRRFIKKAIATAPVILTVTAGPVWAKKNCTWSGQISGNVSLETCEGNEGCTPGFWKNRTELWPSSTQIDPPLHPNSTTFSQVFGILAFDGDPLLVDVIAREKTLDPILPFDPCIGEKKPDKCRDNIKAWIIELASHASAGWLNAVSTVDYFYSPEQAIDLFGAAYMSADPQTMENQKDIFDEMNNYGSPYCR